VTARIRNRIAQDFPAPGSADEVTRLVSGATCCGWGSSPERVQASILLWARGDVGRVRDAVATAKADYRDAVTLGGLAQADWEQKLDTELGPDL